MATTVLGWPVAGAYVAAPVIVDGTVAGLVHAATDPEWSDAEHSAVHVFAQGLGTLLRRAALEERFDRTVADVRALLGGGWPEVAELSSPDVCFETTPRPTTPGGLPTLTDREKEVFAMLLSGATNAQIASRLVIATNTTKMHVQSILRKLGETTRNEAVFRYIVGTRSTVDGA